MNSSSARLIAASVFLPLTLYMGIFALLDLRVASPEQIQDAVKACPGVSERLKFAAGPISIGELKTLLGGCQRQATLEAQKRAAEVPNAAK